MSAAPPPKRQPTKPSGGRPFHPSAHYTVILLGGIVFVAAWLVWTFAFAPFLTR